MTKTKAAADMSLAELEKALEGAKERLSGMEKELTDYRKSVQLYVLEFGKRQRQYEKAFGLMVSESGGHEVGNGRRSRSTGKVARGTMGESILAVLGKATKPIGVDEIVSATEAKSKPSVAQTLMKLVQSGKVQRHNKDGKQISKNDTSQRAKGYSLA